MWQELQPDDPERIGPYRLRGVLGAGGMGRVFLGASADSQLVAVKVIRADLATDPEFRAHFRREVTVARKVSSRFTVPLIDADTDGPVPWLATAYVSGPSLAEAVTEHGPLPVRSVLELATGLAAGLSAIHAAGVVHRDLKPSNVLLAHDGPRVIDFGISVAGETSPLTRTGLLIGSRHVPVGLPDRELIPRAHRFPGGGRLTRSERIGGTLPGGVLRCPVLGALADAPQAVTAPMGLGGHHRAGAGPARLGLGCPDLPPRIAAAEQAPRRPAPDRRRQRERL